MKKILFLGPKSNVKKGLIGGATISFTHLTDYFKAKGDSFSIINTKRYLGFLAGPKNAINIFLQLLIKGANADIIFLNSSRGGTKLLAPLTSLVSLFYGNKFVFRPFGGDLKDYTANYGLVSKWMFRNSVLKADLLYLQTKELIDFFSSAQVNIKQLVTSRKRADKVLLKEAQYRKRLVYIGFINKEKGIDQLLQVKKELGPEYVIHAYGPIKEAKYKRLKSDFYKGVLKKEDVLHTLSKYDVLLLPTYYRGEGYPGAIIESYSLAMPVISTKWKAIPEIVKDGKTGFLIEPRSISELKEAILKINFKSYQELSRNAFQYFNDTFDEEKVLAQVRQDMNEL